MFNHDPFLLVEVSSSFQMESCRDIDSVDTLGGGRRMKFRIEVCTLAALRKRCKRKLDFIVHFTNMYSDHSKPLEFGPSCVTWIRKETCRGKKRKMILNSA